LEAIVKGACVPGVGQSFVFEMIDSAGPEFCDRGNFASKDRNFVRSNSVYIIEAPTRFFGGARPLQKAATSSDNEAVEDQWLRCFFSS
jgi:hypothetical protein